jgi:hypothetical protein
VFFSQVVLLVTQQKHNITFQIVLYTGGHLQVFQGTEVISKFACYQIMLPAQSDSFLDIPWSACQDSPKLHFRCNCYHSTSRETQATLSHAPCGRHTCLHMHILVRLCTGGAQNIHQTSCQSDQIHTVTSIRHYMIHGISPCCGNKNLFSCSLLTQLKTHSSQARPTQMHHRKTFRKAVSPHCETNTLATTTTLASS